MAIVAYPIGSIAASTYIARGTAASVTALYPPSSALVGAQVWFTDRPTAQGGAYVVRESSGTPGTYIYDRVGGGVIVEDSWINLQSYASATYNGCRLRCSDSIGYDVIVVGGVLEPQSVVYRGPWAGRPDASLYPAISGIQITDLGPFITSASNNALTGDWRHGGATVYNGFFGSPDGILLIGGSGGTYSQNGTLVKVTWNSHLIPASVINGCKVHLSISTGGAVTGVYTNFQQTGANTFECTSSVSQNTSGNLANNIAETNIPWTYTYPAGLLRKKDFCSHANAFILAKAAAGTRTYRTYLGGISHGNSTFTAATGLITVASFGAAFFTDTDKILVSAITASPQTIANLTRQISLQLSSATDWFYFSPGRESNTGVHDGT